MGGTELETCPFCGGDAEYIQAGSLWSVQCKSCAAKSNWKFPKKKAAAAWNMRDGKRSGQMTIWEVDR